MAPRPEVSRVRFLGAPATRDTSPSRHPNMHLRRQVLVTLIVVYDANVAEIMCHIDHHALIRPGCVHPSRVNCSRSVILLVSGKKQETHISSTLLFRQNVRGDSSAPRDVFPASFTSFWIRFGGTCFIFLIVSVFRQITGRKPQEAKRYNLVRKSLFSRNILFFLDALKEMCTRVNQS